MWKYEDTAMKSRLFAGMRREEVETILPCLAGTVQTFAKEDCLLRAGEPAGRMGLLLEGAAQVVQEDYWGRRFLVARIEAGELFGESFACLEGETLPVSVIAAEPCTALLLEGRAVLHPCARACPGHGKLMGNLLEILAVKNTALTRKMEHLTRRTNREKLLSYLSEQARRCGGGRFSIPFTRQERADYLAVDRSAMSRELSRMREDGLCNFAGREFVLREPPAPE